MDRERDTPTPRAHHSMFIPVLLVVAALFLMTGFQTVQLTRERELLHERQKMQEEPMAESQNVREQLQSVATGTAALAKEGNENALRIVEQLKRAGISINLEGASTN